MDTNEIMTNEDVIEKTAEELVETSGSCKVLGVTVGVGIAVVCGFIVYKYVARPMLAKLKAKKNTVETVAEVKEESEGDDEDNEESEKD